MNLGGPLAKYFTKLLNGDAMPVSTVTMWLATVLRGRGKIISAPQAQFPGTSIVRFEERYGCPFMWGALITAAACLAVAT